MLLDRFDDDQLALADEAAEAMARLDQAMAARADFSGGMQWKAVKGTEYLMRYWTEADGRKTARSLGPRTKETERLHAEFFVGRERAEAAVQEAGSAAERVGRMGKALRMGRLQSDAVDVLQALYDAELTVPVGPLAVAGGAGLACFEVRLGFFASPRLHREVKTIKLLHDGTSGSSDLAARVAEALGRGARSSERERLPGLAIVDQQDGLGVEVWGMDVLIERAEALGAGREAISQLTLKMRGGADRGIAFGRNSSVVSTAVVPLATYVAAVPYMTAGGAEETELAAERSLAAERLAAAAGCPLAGRVSAVASEARKLVAEQGREVRWTQQADGQSER